MAEKIIRVNDLQKQAGRPTWGYTGEIVTTYPDFANVDVIRSVEAPTTTPGMTRLFTEARVTLNRQLPTGDYVLVRQTNVYGQQRWLPLWGYPVWLSRLEEHKNWLVSPGVLQAACDFITSQCAAASRGTALAMMEDAEYALRKSKNTHARNYAYKIYLDLAKLVLPDAEVAQLRSQTEAAALRSNLKAKSMPVSIAKFLGLQKFPSHEPKFLPIPKNLFVIWPTRSEPGCLIQNASGTSPVAWSVEIPGVGTLEMALRYQIK